MARKRKLTLQDLNSLPVSPVTEYKSDETRAQFYAREAAEQNVRKAAEQEKLMAPVRESETRLRQAAAEATKKVQKFWSLSMQDVSDYGIDFSPLDPIGDYTEGPRDKKAEIAAYTDAEHYLTGEGVTLSPEGWNRVGGYLEALHHHRNVSLASADSWLKAVDRLSLLGCFAGGELTGYENLTSRKPKQATVTPEPTPTWSAVEGLSTEDRGQRKKVLEAVGEDYTSEVAAFVMLWRDQVARDYNYYIPDDILKRALRWCEDTNQNPLRHETWNICRRVFTKNGWMLKPDGSMLLTEREKLSDLCDTQDISNRDVRRQINLKNRELLESEPAFAPHK
jgi:hypothetical protein